ncbi:MAG: hypothetical protein WCJ30_17255 [Deltaproteobacteria bacterium]
MSDHRSPPPGAEACLDRPRPSTQKGGTLIAEDVGDLAAHLRRVRDPDGYRPGECAACQHGTLHVHEYRDRVLLADAESASTPIVIYRCAACAATWRILPRFLARHLWRRWGTVERTTLAFGPPAPSAPRVPDRTARRWRQRLASSARLLIQIVAVSGSAVLTAIVSAAGLEATRAELVAAYASAVAPAATPGGVLASLAALVHRLGRGPRLM